MKKKIDKIPAQLDFLQSATGLILAVFIMGHLLFEASILISNEMMYKVTIMFEGYYFFGEKYPGIVSFMAMAISVIFVLHGAIALRKMPTRYKEYKTIRKHAASLNHEDTDLWLLQVVTGFMMFFLASVHLYIMIGESSHIGPYISSSRIVDDYMGVLYFLLLLSVVSHAFVGLYRLAVKWGFMEGRDAKRSRKRFKLLMKLFIAVYLVVGLSSLAKYTYIGLTNDFSVSGKYKSLDVQ